MPLFSRNVERFVWPRSYFYWSVKRFWLLLLIDSKPLSSLLERESDLLKICHCLDAPMAGVGHYRAVALYYGCNHYQIVSVFEKHWGGPSRALIEFLQAQKPELTVAEFASVVGKEADRNDVDKLLKEYDLK